MPSLVRTTDYAMGPDVSGITQALQWAIDNRREDDRFAQQEERVRNAENRAIAQARLEETGVELLRVTNIENPIDKKTALTRLASAAIDRGESPDIYNKALEINNPDELDLYLMQVIDRASNATEVLKAHHEQQFGGDVHASAGTDILDDGTVVRVLSDGKRVVTDANGNPVKGEAAAKAIQAAHQKEEDRKQRAADIEVGKQKEIAENESLIQRRNDLKGEYSAQARQAATDSILLNEALTLASRATQGAAGRAKERLSQLVPGIDVSDEAALDSALKRMALDQLAKFKGPTTDFEFGVVQDISGKLGNARSSNIARIKALQRNGWFLREQARQFRDWQGDPDDYEFNMAEVRAFGDKTFTLQEIQNTAVHNNMNIEEALTVLNQRFGK